MSAPAVQPGERAPWLGSLARFLRLWLLLAFSNALLRFLFNLGVRRYVDISSHTLDELVYVPLLEAAVFWQLVRWHARATGTGS